MRKTGAATLFAGLPAGPANPRTQPPTPRPPRRSFPHSELQSLSLAQIQSAFRSRALGIVELTSAYLDRIRAIDQTGPRLRSVIEVNPDALAIAKALEKELRHGASRSPLHGIPILIKDNIATHDRLHTSAGSLALADSIASADAFLVRRLRDAGAVILGKTNLSEWANFRGSNSISGWSARGGQTRNPHCLDRSPSGSSSGSAAAAAAALCAAAVGTETDGSIVSPANHCGVVGLKPTVGLVSRSGIIPISHSQDTAGPMTRSVDDAARLLDALQGQDDQDPATRAAASFSVKDMSPPSPESLRGARLGVLRSSFGFHPLVDVAVEKALQILQSAGAILIDPVHPPARSDLGDAEFQTMLYEFKDGLNRYLASLGPGSRIHNLEELIAFNEEHRDRELPFFGQSTLVAAQTKGPLTETRYLEARKKCVAWSRTQGLEAMFEQHRLDALVAPTGGPAHTLDHVAGDRWLGGSSTLSAVSGYPHITVPCGLVWGLPVGLSFMGLAWSEAKLLRLAGAFEAASSFRHPPRYQPTLQFGELI